MAPRRALAWMLLGSAIAAGGATAAASAALSPGQIVVVDARAFGPGCADVGAPGCGGLITVDPATGAERTLSSNAMPVNASSQLFDIPFTLALEANGDVL